MSAPLGEVIAWVLVAGAVVHLVVKAVGRRSTRPCCKAGCPAVPKAPSEPHKP